MAAQFSVWQGTEGDWKWSLKLDNAPDVSGPYHGHATYEKAVEEVTAVAREIAPAAEKWLRVHG